MKASVGIHEQFLAYKDIIDALSKLSRSLQKRIIKGKCGDVFSEIYQYKNLLPFLDIRENGNQIEVSFDDVNTEKFIIEMEEPVIGLNILAHAFLPEYKEDAVDHYDLWQEFAVNRLEKDYRAHHGIVKTDGLTAWVMALEGSRYKDVDHDDIRNEIHSALKERRIISGTAAEMIKEGWKKIKNCEGINGYKCHWDYSVERRENSIAEIRFFKRWSYEGPRATSQIRFSKKLDLKENAIAVETPVLPDAAIASIPGKNLEAIIGETRLNGWNFLCKDVTSSKVQIKDEWKNELLIKLNRDSWEAGVCFQE